MISNTFHQYANDLKEALDGTNEVGIENASLLIEEALSSNATLFVAGNGGSAATASHMAADLCKTILGKKPVEVEKRLKTISLSDNVPLLTAYGNDVSYECIFGEQLRTLGRAGDVLLVISASGNSANIIYAIEAAKKMGIKTIGFLGFGGGKALELVDVPIVIPSSDYGIVEDGHSILMHVLTQHLKSVIVNFNA